MVGRNEEILMRLLVIGLSAMLVLTACGKKVPPAEVGPAPLLQSDPAGEVASDVDLIELPALQAKLVAQANSDTVFLGPMSRRWVRRIEQYWQRRHNG